MNFWRFLTVYNEGDLLSSIIPVIYAKYSVCECMGLVIDSQVVLLLYMLGMWKLRLNDKCIVNFTWKADNISWSMGDGEFVE